MIYEVSVTEEGSSYFHLNDIYHFASWDDMKKQYPILLKFLKNLSNNQLWSSENREYNRIYFVGSINRNKGLYDIKKTVWFNAKEEHAKELKDIKKQNDKKYIDQVSTKKN